MEVDKKFTAFVLDSLKQTASNSKTCTVMVDDVEFMANKTHLRSCSKFFREVFSTESRIVIKGIKPKTYKVVHMALLTGKIALNEANMIDVWFASSYLEIQFLPEKCEDYIQQNLTKSNYLFLFFDALDMGSNMVSDKIITLIVEDFERFSLTQWFLDLPTKMLMKVLENCKNISVDILAQSVDQWLQYDPQVHARNYQVQFEHNVGETDDTETNSIQTFIFNKELVRKTDDSYTNHSEKRKESKLKLFRLIMKFKYNFSKNDGTKYFTKIVDGDWLKDNVSRIPTWTAMFYTGSDINCVGLDHIQNNFTSDDEPVVVFIRKCQFTLYSLNTHDFYVLDFIKTKLILEFDVYNNELYFSSGTSTNMFHVMRSQRVLEMNEGVMYKLANATYFMVFPFIYKFQLEKEELIASRFCVETENGQWNEVDRYYVADRYGNVNIFCFEQTVSDETKILFVHDEYIVCFDLKRLQLFKNSIGVRNRDRGVISLRPYDFLHYKGNLFKIEEIENCLQLTSLTVWDDNHLTMLGAEFYDNTLFIFTTGSSLEQCDIKKNLGFNVKIVKLLGAITQQKCSFMTVPAEWLTNKI